MEDRKWETPMHFCHLPFAIYHQAVFFQRFANHPDQGQRDGRPSGLCADVRTKSDTKATAAGPLKTVAAKVIPSDG
jgi:hypothetical protein